MTFEEVRQAIATKMVGWSGLTADRVTYENYTFTPPASGVWCRVTIQNADSMIACLGAVPQTRDLGAIVIQVFDRQGAGTKNINVVADSLRAWLEYYKVSGLELLQGSKQTIGSDGNGFYQINLRFEYRAG